MSRPSLPGLPRSRRDVRLVGRTVRLVLGVPAYAALALAAALAGLTATVASQNATLFVDTLAADWLTLRERAEILLYQYPFVGGGSLGDVAVTLVAGLTGVNVAVLVYHLREHSLSVSGGSGSLAGVVLGTLGGGCVACGPAVLAGGVTLFGAGTLAALPLHGLELMALPLLLLGLSLYWLADGMRGGRTEGCPVDP